MYSIADFKPVRCADTDFGFILVRMNMDEFYLEIYGMVGIGRFELLSNCSYPLDDDPQESLDYLLDEIPDQLSICRRTKEVFKNG